MTSALLISLVSILFLMKFTFANGFSSIKDGNLTNLDNASLILLFALFLNVLLIVLSFINIKANSAVPYYFFILFYTIYSIFTLMLILFVVLHIEKPPKIMENELEKIWDFFKETIPSNLKEKLQLKYFGNYQKIKNFNKTIVSKAWLLLLVLIIVFTFQFIGQVGNVNEIKFLSK